MLEGFSQRLNAQFLPMKYNNMLSFYGIRYG